MDEHGEQNDRPCRIVVVGGGFAGFHATRRLVHLLHDGPADRRQRVEVVLINPTDYFLYLPLLPEVTAGIVDPRRVCVPLTQLGPGVRLILGTVDRVDVAQRRMVVVGSDGARADLRYDRLLLTVGSVNRLLPIPGVAAHAYPYRSLGEAVRLRDHLLDQIDRAAAGVPTPSAKQRIRRCTFVVVGAGYTGTEIAAHGQQLTRALAGRYPELRHQRVRWLLLDHAPRILPELAEPLARSAHRILSGRGVEIKTGVTVEEVTDDGVLCSDGEFVPTGSLIWCVGVRPDPLVETLGLPTVAGRLSVDAHLAVPGHPEIFVCGDAAGVPDLTRPGRITGMTAQHAVRQGHRVAGDLAASLGVGRSRAYHHRDLGFAVDLAGFQATANPAGIPVSGPLAKVLTRGYHLAAIPGNRVRIAADWLLSAVLPRQVVRPGLTAIPASQERQPAAPERVRS
jgi:NADH dehydrogenase